MRCAVLFLFAAACTASPGAEDMAANPASDLAMADAGEAPYCDNDLVVSNRCCPDPPPGPCVPGRWEYACSTDCVGCDYNENCGRGGGIPADGAPCQFPGLICEFAYFRRVLCDCDGIAHW